MMYTQKLYPLFFQSLSKILALTTCCLYPSQGMNNPVILRNAFYSLPLTDFDLVANNLMNLMYSGNSIGILQDHKRSKANVWTWLIVATVTAGAVTVCILCPASSTEVISGAVQIGTAIIAKHKKK